MKTHVPAGDLRCCSDRLCSVLLCCGAQSDSEHRLPVQKPDKELEQHLSLLSTVVKGGASREVNSHQESSEETVCYNKDTEVAC